jgi:hypothetical protein
MRPTRDGNGGHMNNENRLRSDESGRAHRERPSTEPTQHVIESALEALNEAHPGEAYLALAMAAVWADRLTEDARRLREEVHPLGLRPSPEAQNAVERVRHEVAYCTAAIERVRREIERARSRA